MKFTRAVVSAGVGCVVGSGLAIGTAAWGHHVDNLVPYTPPGAIEPSAIKQTDNRNVYYYMDSGGDERLEADDRRVVTNMISSQYAPTDLNFYYDSTPVFSGSAETDTIWQEGPVSGSAEGRAWCNDTVGQFSCDQHYVRIEWGQFSQGLSCHELGHAVGLTHGQNAYPRVSQTEAGLRCMRTPVSSGDILGPHNVGQINGAY